MVKNLVLAVFLVGICSAATTEDWKSRTVYQILIDRFAIDSETKSPCPGLPAYKYGSRLCGGNFKGIQENLDYIQNLGFDAIELSPIFNNVPHSWQGYNVVDFYNLNPSFGTQQDLLDLITECHSRGIYVMLDIVINNVGNVYGNYQKISPFNRREYYHPYCSQPSTWNETLMEKCWIGELPDLDHSNSFVRETLLNWISELVYTFGFDGFRVDSAWAISKDFLSEFSKNAGTYIVGDVGKGDQKFQASFQGPLSAVSNAGLYYTLRSTLKEGRSMEYSVQYFNSTKVYGDPNALGNYLDDRMNSRFLYHNNDLDAYKNALTWVLCDEGIPFIFYGVEQGLNQGPTALYFSYLSQTNSTTYQIVKQIVKARKENSLYYYPRKVLAYGTNYLAMSRGESLIVLTNSVQETQLSLDLSGFDEGKTLCNVFDPSECIQVTKSQSTVLIKNAQPMLFVPK